jgi:hypothetical protein
LTTTLSLRLHGWLAVISQVIKFLKLFDFQFTVVRVKLTFLHLCFGTVNLTCSLVWLLLGRQFPDKAIDLIDEACTTVNLRKQNEVTNVKGSIINTPTEVGAGHVAQVNLHS